MVSERFNIMVEANWFEEKGKMHIIDQGKTYKKIYPDKYKSNNTKSIKK